MAMSYQGQPVENVKNTLRTPCTCVFAFAGGGSGTIKKRSALGGSLLGNKKQNCVLSGYSIWGGLKRNHIKKKTTRAFCYSSRVSGPDSLRSSAESCQPPLIWSLLVWRSGVNKKQPKVQTKPMQTKRLTGCLIICFSVFMHEEANNMAHI